MEPVSRHGKGRGVRLTREINDHASYCLPRWLGSTVEAAGGGREEYGERKEEGEREKCNVVRRMWVETCVGRERKGGKRERRKKWGRERERERERITPAGDRQSTCASLTPVRPLTG